MFVSIWHHERGQAMTASEYSHLHRIARDGGRDSRNFYSHFEAPRGDRYVPAAGIEPDFVKLTDSEHLLATFENLKAVDEKAPGPDGTRYQDLGRGEAAAAMRDLSQRLQHESWRPTPARTTYMPKSGGGRRPLRIRSIFTNIVSKMLHDGLQSFWDERFHECSYAYRPNRGVWQLLASLLWKCRMTNCWVVSQADIRNAFEHANINHLMRIHRQNLSCERLLRLIETLLRCKPNGKCGRKTGIDQGGAYSVHCLNARLHEMHDVHIKDDVPGWWRYSDDLTYLSQSVSEGRALLQDVNRLFASTEFTLKRAANHTQGTVVDLQSGQRAKLLGFTVTLHDERFHYELHRSSLEQLRIGLLQCHEAPDPVCSAQSRIRGWILAHGPVFEVAARRSTLSQVLRLQDQCGLSDCIGLEELMLSAARAYQCWKSCIRRGKTGTDGDGWRSAHANDSGNRDSACPVRPVPTMDCQHGAPF